MASKTEAPLITPRNLTDRYSTLPGQHLPPILTSSCCSGGAASDVVLITATRVRQRTIKRHGEVTLSSSQHVMRLRERDGMVALNSNLQYIEIYLCTLLPANDDWMIPGPHFIHFHISVHGTFVIFETFNCLFNT